MPKKAKTSRKRIIDLTQNFFTDSVQEKTQLEIRSLPLRKLQTIQFLNGTHMPSEFRFRETQVGKIEAFLQACLKGQKKGYRFLMVTGSPGAGKTLSVTNAISKMKCDVIRMNANSVKSVAQVQEKLCEQLLGDCKPRTASQILRQLQDKQYDKCCIIYIEEIQLLFKSAPDVVSQDFLALFLKKTVNLVLVGISNTIDTLQKYSGNYSFKVTDIENVVFSPYKAEQIQVILTDKIKHLKEKFKIIIEFPEKLLKFAAQKLQTWKKGDFRLCAQFLKQVVTTLFCLDSSQDEIFSVTIAIINDVFDKMHISKNELMSSLPYHLVIILIALHNIIRKTDGLYVSMAELQPELKWICNSLQIANAVTQLQPRLKQLQQYGMITVRRRKNYETQILLQVGVDDVKATFQENEMMSKFLTG